MLTDATYQNNEIEKKGKAQNYENDVKIADTVHKVPNKLNE